MNEKNTNQQSRNENLSTRNAAPAEEGLKINGLAQVVEMLRYADPAFRESLLKRIAQRDPALAMSLKRIIR